MCKAGSRQPSVSTWTARAGAERTEAEQEPGWLGNGVMDRPALQDAANVAAVGRSVRGRG